MNQISAFGQVMLFLVGGLIAALGGMIVSKLLRPNRPNPEKLSTYECGEDPVGNSWIQFNMRFYVMALIFLIFDVEVIFLFPWALVYTHPDLLNADIAWTAFAFIEILFFSLILIVGLAWIWFQGDLGWVKPNPLITQSDSPIPDSAYQWVNNLYNSSKPVSQENKLPPQV
jgi:NADH-quinone oxidoreductase subunit A